MNQERVVFFLDFANINRGAQDSGIAIDYGHLRSYMGAGRFLIDSHAYVPIDPRNEHRLDQLLQRLWEDGYVVRNKVGVVAGNTYKCDFDVEITMDVLSTAYQVRPDIIVLATGDSDFIPLVQEVRRLGVRVEVASFERSASRDLKLRASGFISLDAYTQELFAEHADSAAAIVEEYSYIDERRSNEIATPPESGQVEVNEGDVERSSVQQELPRVPHAEDE